MSVLALRTTADAIRRQGLRCTPFQPCKNDKRCTPLILAVRPCFCIAYVIGRFNFRTMSLDTHRKGYAVMSEDLQGISFDDESLESCKRYCRKGYVIAERIPYVSGFQLRVFWAKWWKPIKMMGYYPRNFLWLHWSVSKIHFHKTGKIVHRADG